ncbi:MAG: two-component regulator propeller domain-containing protein [Acidobacteriota bacterium]
MNKSKTLPRFIFILILFLSSFSYGQNSEWVNFYGPNYPNCVAVDGNYIWTGTRTGLMRFNRLTFQKDFYYTFNSGLPDNYVTSIAADKNGFIWIGTGRGIAKFDGKTWTVFNSSNSELPGDAVTSIVIDTSGSIWVGTSESGIARFNGATWTVFNLESGLKDNRVTTLALDKRNNTVYAGFYSTGVAKFNGTKWLWIEPGSLYPTFYYTDITSLAVDSGGTLWAGTSRNGLEKYEGAKWDFYSNDNNGDWIFPQTLCIGKDNELWIGAANKLLRYDIKAKQFSVFSSYYNTLPFDEIRGITLDSEGNLWLAARHPIYHIGNLLKFNRQSFEQIYIESSSLPPGSISCVARENGGAAWIGTLGYGVVKYDGSNWSRYDKSNSGLISNSVNTIAIDSAGNKWIGTDEGLSEFDGTGWSNFKTPGPVFASNKITSIAFDRKNHKWIGTPFGLFEFDGINWATYTSDTVIPDNTITALNVDKDGTIWIGTYGNGIASFDGLRWTIFNSSTSDIPFNDIAAMTIDAYGRKWIATIEHGIILYDGNSWKLFTSENSGLPFYDIKSLSTDSYGNLWAGSSGSGLARFDGTSWKLFKSSNSYLSDNHINHLFADRLNNLWISTNDGISIYREGGVVMTDVAQRRNNSNPENYRLGQNYPNPFNPVTKIDYEIPVSGFAELSVYDVLGNEVACLVKSFKPAGKYTLSFDGSSLPSGIYYYRLRTDSFSETRKLMILK